MTIRNINIAYNSLRLQAMHMTLTGENMTAQEAAGAGLVAKVVDVEETVPRAIEYAQKIASYSAPVVAMAKEAVNAGKYDFRGTLLVQLNLPSRRPRTEGWLAF